MQLERVPMQSGCLARTHEAYHEDLVHYIETLALLAWEHAGIY